MEAGDGAGTKKKKEKTTEINISHIITYGFPGCLGDGMEMRGREREEDETENETERFISRLH